MMSRFGEGGHRRRICRHRDVEWWQRASQQSGVTVQMIATARDAEENAASQMQQLGFVNVKVAPDGTDGGIDVECGNAIAQVKWRTETTGRPDVQRLYGARGISHDKAMLFFSASGYSKGAEVYADEVGMCLFIYNQTGAIVPASSAAKALVTARAAALAAEAVARAAASDTETAHIATGPPAALMRAVNKQWKALGFDSFRINPSDPCQASATNSADDTLRVFWCGEVADLNTVRGRYGAATSYPRKHMVMVAGTKFSAEVKTFAQSRPIALFVWRADEQLVPTNSAARTLSASPQPAKSPRPQPRKSPQPQPVTRSGVDGTNRSPRSSREVSSIPAHPASQPQPRKEIQPWVQVQPSRQERRTRQAREAKDSSRADTPPAVRVRPRPEHMSSYEESASTAWVLITIALMLGAVATGGAVWLWWFVGAT
ncbi:hypothetical protein CHR55_27300 [Rhodococcus qingshengii]|uniref:Restriction endonuclease type IV Mrr domain-containing protein n=1 Tax=Rhodococcus qingshengii TaxID=334542 RepID=A0A2A5J3J4_RHOSG|nr:hypothetical protein CHR55_27300 [Rhodococcus qingshengii]